jgi:hypothetical protein
MPNYYASITKGSALSQVTRVGLLQLICSIKCLVVESKRSAPPLDTILSQFHRLSSSYPVSPEMHLVRIPIFFDLSNDRLLTCCHTKILYTFLLSLIIATCPARDLLYFSVVTSAALYKAQSCSLRNVLNCPFAKSLGSKCFSENLVRNICTLFFSQGKKPRSTTNRRS